MASKWNSPWPHILTPEQVKAFFKEPPKQKECSCNLMASGCTCGVMDEEMKAKGFVRARFGPKKWVKAGD